MDTNAARKLSKLLRQAADAVDLLAGEVDRLNLEVAGEPTPLADCEIYDRQNGPIFSVRTLNILDRHNLRTLRQISELDEKTFSKLYGVGATVVAEVKKKLAEAGLSFSATENIAARRRMHTTGG